MTQNVKYWAKCSQHDRKTNSQICFTLIFNVTIHKMIFYITIHNDTQSKILGKVLAARQVWGGFG